MIPEEDKEINPADQDMIVFDPEASNEELYDTAIDTTQQSSWANQSRQPLYLT